MNNKKPVNQNDEVREMRKLAKKRLMRYLSIAEVLSIILVAGFIALAVYGFLEPTINKEVAITAAGAAAGGAGAAVHGVINAYRSIVEGKDAK